MDSDADVTTLSDQELLEAIAVVEENLAEVGARSSYASRNQPLLRRARAEATRRGLR